MQHDQTLAELEKQLTTTQKALEQATMVKNQFLANMSHELRTPLNGIMGMMQILLNSDLTDDQREYVALSLEASRHLNKVLNNMLALSAIENNAMQQNRAPFNLHNMVDSLLSSFMNQAADKSLNLSYEITPEVPQLLHGDGMKLQQVLINLLGNALNFTQQGEVSLHIFPSKHQPHENEIQLKFAVSDSGPGIPEHMHTSIFENFTLGEDYMTKQYGGSGLGLSIVHQLAQVMNGTIELESTPGKGSIFRLTAPFESIEQPIKSPPPPAETEPSDALNILLAEDEQVNSIMASRLLRNAGHHVMVVGNGQQAIDALSRTPFDLVLMDVQMPVVNGLRATQIIRSGAVEGVPRDLPIIGLTAYAQSEEKQSFLKAGMQQIVTKPFEPDELLKAIHQTLG